MVTCILSQSTTTTVPHGDDDDEDDENEDTAAAAAAAAAADYCYITTITTNRGYYISILLAMSCIKYETIYQLVRNNVFGCIACYYC